MKLSFYFFIVAISMKITQKITQFNLVCFILICELSSVIKTEYSLWGVHVVCLSWYVQCSCYCRLRGRWLTDVRHKESVNRDLRTKFSSQAAMNQTLCNAKLQQQLWWLGSLEACFKQREVWGAEHSSQNPLIQSRDGSPVWHTVVLQTLENETLCFMLN